MKHYPLLFTFVDWISWNGFLVRVVINGRVLAAEEEGGWWMYGVEPGDLAAGGTTFMEAQTAFRKTFRAILFDIADEADDLKSFRAEIGRFFRGMNRPVEEEWQAAVLEVRAGLITADSISAGLPTKPAESGMAEVKLLQLFRAKDKIAMAT